MTDEVAEQVEYDAYIDQTCKSCMYWSATLGELCEACSDAGEAQ